MGSLRKKTSTKPLPTGAELFDRKGQQFVRWNDSCGKTRTAKLTTGHDGSQRIVVQSSRWTAKFRDGSGVIQEVNTGCRDKSAAQTMLTDLERRAELVRSGVMTASDESVADHQPTRLVDHLEGFIRSLKAAGRSDRHISDTDRLAKQITADCGFRVLRDIEADRVESWLVDKLDAGMAARTRNSYLGSLKGFCAWCVRNRRLMTNPIRSIPKADERVLRRNSAGAMHCSPMPRCSTCQQDYSAFWTAT